MKSARLTPSLDRSKAPTGIDGFDGITGGGLPRGGDGAPGRKARPR